MWVSLRFLRGLVGFAGRTRRLLWRSLPVPRPASPRRLFRPVASAWRPGRLRSWWAYGPRAAGRDRCLLAGSPPPPTDVPPGPIVSVRRPPRPGQGGSRKFSACFSALATGGTRPRGAQRRAGDPLFHDGQPKVLLGLSRDQVYRRGEPDAVAV